MRTDHCSCMHYRAQRHVGNRERQHCVGMVVYYRIHFGPRTVDCRMDHAFAVGCAAPRINRHTLQIEFHQIRVLDQCRAARARHHKAFGITRITHTDMAEGIHYTLIGQDAIGSHQTAELHQISQQRETAGSFLRQRGGQPECQCGTAT